MTRDDILKKYIEIVIFCEKATYEKYGDPEWMPDLTERLIKVCLNELKNPRVVQTRYLFKDVREKIDGYPKNWVEPFLQKITENFGEQGLNFKRNQFVIDPSSFGKPISID